MLQRKTYILRDKVIEISPPSVISIECAFLKISLNDLPVAQGEKKKKHLQ